MIAFRSNPPCDYLLINFHFCTKMSVRSLNYSFMGQILNQRPNLFRDELSSLYTFVFEPRCQQNRREKHIGQEGVPESL